MIVDEWWTSKSIKLGDSNVDSDVVNDGDMQLKGNEILSVTPSFFERKPYTSGSYERGFRIGIKNDIGNGSVGECIVIFGSSQTTYGLFRATFNPPLDNVTGYRLYLDFTIGVSDGNNP